MMTLKNIQYFKMKIFYEKEINPKLLTLLDKNESVKVHYDFQSKSKECLATTHAWFGISF